MSWINDAKVVTKVDKEPEAIRTAEMAAKEAEKSARKAATKGTKWSDLSKADVDSILEKIATDLGYYDPS